MAISPIQFRPARLSPFQFVVPRIGFPGLQGVITSVSFPSQLKPGESITGTITVANPNTVDHTYEIHVIPQWDTTKETTASASVPAGQSHVFNFPADFGPAANLPLAMPPKQAVLTIRALDETGANVGETTVTINVPFLYQQICIGTFCIPTWALLAGAAFLVIIGVVATRKKK